MKLGAVANAVLAVLSSAAAAAAQNVVEFNLHRGIPGLHLGTLPQLGRRDTYTQLLINNITGGGYYCEVTVGTPPQPITMILDTGSSDAWVLSPKADLCTSRALQEKYQDSCGNTYDNTKSQTYKLVERNGFSIQYLDNGTAKGDYITEDFSIAGVTIKNLQMGHVLETVRGIGILGIGYTANVATRKVYPNIMDQLTNQKIIGLKAYSLYLNDRRSSSGTILFGGIDTNKFVGPLHIVPIMKSFGLNVHTAFEIAFTGLGVTYTNGSTAEINTNLFKATSLPAILDSGSTLSYVPEQLAKPIFRELGAVTDNTLTGLTFIDCKHLDDDPRMVIRFNFDGKEIKVPVNEMVLDILGAYQHLLPSNIPYERVCMFGIQSTKNFDTSETVEKSNFALLGDTFLRSAYVVYSLDHHQIGIAQANLNSTSAAIVELKSGDKALPAVTGVPEPSPTDGGVATVTVTAKNAAPGSVRFSGGLEALAVLAITSICIAAGGVIVSL
ncbi:aspartic-type endopeptidase [Podospora aff. communis PSN243]|uniref:Aspartic-type endopeptidase n=1 Tax=Podospora aff. communis PSN243 TaxID=3040156 RepID=A0AAV9GZB8_9PEZI|nr:aspartic-type endopeptidase [Podospora aff. communis PSN243]